MRPRDLLDRAREMIARREASKTGEPRPGTREWLRRNVIFKWVAPDGTVTKTETLAERWDRRDVRPDPPDDPSTFA